MRFSQLFGQTLREAPAEAETAGHRLLLRAGFIRPLGAGIFSYLHLARRSLDKIEAILREEMDAIGGQEITMPVVHPADLWKETGHWQQIGDEMGRFRDRNGHDMVLAMAHEDVVADLVRREVQSYRQLPRLIYHIQTKWRDDPRPRAGLIRAREFTMKDSYSLDADQNGLERQYRAHYRAYFRIFRRCGLDVIAVKSDPGMTLEPERSAGAGGTLAHEFMYLTPIGEDTLLLCDACGYRANRQVARFRKPAAAPETPKPLEKVRTPGCKSIEDLANFLGVPKARTAKAVFFIATIPDGEATREEFIFAVIRGDMDLNETKLANALGARELRPASEDEIRRVGAEPGFASPVDLPPSRHSPAGKGVQQDGVRVILDDSIPASPNLVAGANEPDYHLRNTNYPRDYRADLVTDIAAAEAGCACPQCGAALRAERGVEVGNISRLGTRYAEALGCTFRDRDGTQKPIVMGSYRIGVGRLLACIAEAHHDEQGLIWPVSVAPFDVHLIALRGGMEKAEELHGRWNQAGVSVLFDDRDESPGVKFNDADLIGLPLRVTVSERGLAAGVAEVKLRCETEKKNVPLSDLDDHIRTTLAGLRAELEARAAPEVEDAGS